MENAIKTISITLDGFIIPVNGGVVGDYMKDSTGEYLHKVGQLNGIEIGENDKVVQLWLVGGESNNCARHGFKVMDNGQQIQIHNFNMEFIPAKILEGATEGSRVKYLIPCRRSDVEYEILEPEFILEVSMICKQLEYRYSYSGKFEEVFKLVSGK